MKGLIASLAVGVLFSTAALTGCSSRSNQSPDVTSTIRQSLDQAGLKDVSVSQDRDKGVVTLGGHVDADSQKQQAESIAKSAAAGQVVSDQIAVQPPNASSEAKTVNADEDKAIDKNLDAALVKHHMNHGVHYKVENGVVTLTGDVSSQARRAEVEKIATAVPNVKQVVNELQLNKHQKATTSSGGL
jgi:hyperosmotically inducible periplasmic protein